MGTGLHIPNIVSPVTGEEEARPSTGFIFCVLTTLAYLLGLLS